MPNAKDANGNDCPSAHQKRQRNIAFNLKLQKNHNILISNARILHENLPPELNNNVHIKAILHNSEAVQALMKENVHHMEQLTKLSMKYTEDNPTPGTYRAEAAVKHNRRHGDKI